MSRADALKLPGKSVSVDHGIVAEAADWLVKLHTGEMSKDEQRELFNWRQQSPQHERAWRAATELSRTFGDIPAHIGMPVLERQRLDRRTVIKSLAILLTAAPTGYAAYQLAPWREWSADVRTATGEQRSLTLADGSHLMLNTDSAADVQFDENQRLIILQAGEIFIETAPDNRGRPFLVQTPQGRIRALGTRFSVRQFTGQGTDWTEVAVLEHAVEIQPQDSVETIVLQAGRQSRFTRRQIRAPQPVSLSHTAWTRGQLIADKHSLGEFLTELGRYRPGLLRCDPQVADLQLSGVFQIDNTDRALSIIQETLPVSLNYRTRYWVTVGPQQPS